MLLLYGSTAKGQATKAACTQALPLGESCSTVLSVAGMAGSAYVARPDRGRLNCLRSALCTLHAGQGCLVGAA